MECLDPYSFHLLGAFVLGDLINKEAMKKMAVSPPFGKTEKILAYSTHMVIMPFTVIYSIFLPLKLGTVWLYVGLPICFLALAMYLIATINIATTPLDEPVTKGVYRTSRHPVYFAGFWTYVGIGIPCASRIFLLRGTIFIILMRIWLPSEEGFRLEQYGDAYREYVNRTPRWIGLPKSGVK